jgi:glycosyltransferase involved in cell wall biosynthesis
MVKSRLSVIIPSRNERFLQKTVEDVLAKAQGDIEVVVILEGYWPDPPLKQDPRVVVIHNSVAHGMRNAINAGMAVATGEYLMKLDAHCMLGEGFDVIMKADCDDDWLVVPRRLSLEPETWTILENGKAPVDAHYLSWPFQPDKPGRGLHGTVWNERARLRKDILIDEEMSSQGSSWFTHRNHWNRIIGPMSCEGYGRFVQEMQELGLKTWLSGGKLMVNKKTWYAHLHKGSKYGRGYVMSGRETEAGTKYSVDYWMYNQWADRKYDIDWLIDRFWPVPSWPENWRSLVPARGTFNYDMKAAYNVPITRAND